MTVSSDTQYASFHCNGSTGYPFTFSIYEPEELKVILINDSTEVETTLVYPGDYTVTGIPTAWDGSGNAIAWNFESGGTVTTTATYTSGYTLVITTDIPLTQEFEFTENMPTLYKTFEKGLDKSIRLIKQIVMTAVDGSVALGMFIADLASTATGKGDALIGYKASGTGATARTLHDRMQDFSINVFDYMTSTEIADVRANTGLVDVTVDLQKAITAAKAKAQSVHFPAGTYYITDSLDFTGVNDGLGFPIGWTIYGDGEGSTKIKAKLSGAYPVIDFTGTQQPTLRDIQIYGDASGSQICGVLHSNINSQRSNEGKIEDVLINGTYSQAAYINYASDLSTLSHVHLAGPIGALYTAIANALGSGVIKSQYQTLTTSPNTTIHYINDCYISGTGGDSGGFNAAVVSYEIENVNIIHSYLAQETSAVSGIRVVGIAGGYSKHRIVFQASRYENQSNNMGTFLYSDVTGGSLHDCIFEGYVGGKGADTGQIFYLKGSDMYGSRIMLSHAGSFSSGHFVQHDSSELIRECEIFDVDADQLIGGRDAALFGTGNIFHLNNWDANFINVANNNYFYTRDKGLILFSYDGFNRLGNSTNLIRRFNGALNQFWGAAKSTGAGSDVSLLDYSLPGDVTYAYDVYHRAHMRLVGTGYFAANTNAKTLKAKFGISGSETVVVYNDVTAAPNGTKFIIEVDFFRVSYGADWEYCGKLFAGSVLQSVTRGYISADPSSHTIKVLITGDAADSDIYLTDSVIEVF